MGFETDFENILGNEEGYVDYGPSWREESANAPHLSHSQDQAEDDGKAQEFINEWWRGGYSGASLASFACSRSIYLYDKHKLNKNSLNNRYDLLKFLCRRNPEFKKDLYRLREKLFLENVPNDIEFRSRREAVEILAHNYLKVDWQSWIWRWKNDWPDDWGDADDEEWELTERIYASGVSAAVMEILAWNDLGNEWYDVIMCQIISPEVEQLKMVKEMHIDEKVHILGINGGKITVELFPGFRKEELDILWKTVGNSTKYTKKNYILDINDMILKDKNAGMSWKRMGDKYGMPTDTIRQRILYSKKSGKSNSKL